MALFDSIIEGAKQRFGLDTNAAGGLLAALLAFITDPVNGGFSGILDRFRNAGLGDVVNSWIGTGDNKPLTDAQVESALGSDSIDSIASQAGVDRGTATSAIAGMMPQVVDQLTPDGTIPDDSSLLARIGGFLSGWGGAVAGGIGAAAGAASGAAGATFDKGKEIVGSSVGNVRNIDGPGETAGAGSILKWLIPLLLLGLVLVIGYMFCGRSSTPTVTTNANLNANVNRSNMNLNANVNRTNSAVTDTANTNAAAEANRTLSEVTLPNGAKLQAYAGGIEDQLVKFIASDAYKNGTNDQLKDRWFNFDDLNFKFGTTELAPESKRQLDNIAAILKAYPDVKIKIGGYTDKKGDDAANLRLSDGRAKAVQAALKAAGVGAQVPEAEGYGEQFATVDENASDEARKVDRKTAVRLIK